MSGPWRSLTDLRPGIDTALLDLYVAELLRWNKVIRLVGPRDAEGMARQVTDALLPFLHEPPVFPLLDVGSGAGLPAIPLAVAWPGERVVCLEPRDKRVSFLRHATRTLGLRSVEVVQGRSETACAENPDLSHAFACVTARAVSDVATLLAWAEPFLVPGGRVILGRGGEGETRVPGWSLVRWRTYEGPEGVGLRAVAAYKREA